MKIRELLSDESKWTKGWFARDANGISIIYGYGVCSESVALDGRACSWCLTGACKRCYPDTNDWWEKLKDIKERLIQKGYYGTSLSSWNDAPERTFAEVKALVEELDI